MTSAVETLDNPFLPRTSPSKKASQLSPDDSTRCRIFFKLAALFKKFYRCRGLLDLACGSPCLAADATSTIDLLKVLEKSHPKANNIYVLLDNAKYHFADIVREYVKDSKIKLIPLPAYSPGRVKQWRGNKSRWFPSIIPFPLPAASNRTCATNASGFRSKYHAFALGTSVIFSAIA